MATASARHLARSSSLQHLRQSARRDRPPFAMSFTLACVEYSECVLTLAMVTGVLLAADGNVFDQQGPPAEIAKLACPTGAKPESRKYVPDPHKENTILAPGWIFRCVQPNGTPDGPWVVWNRLGIVIGRGAFVAGKRDGTWEGRRGSGVTHYKAGHLEGNSTEISGGQVSSDENFVGGYRQGPNKFRTESGELTLDFDRGALKTQLPPGEAEILIANVDIPQGTTITPKMVARGRSSSSLKGAVVSPRDWAMVATQSVRCNVVKGAPLLWGDLEVTGELDVRRFIEVGGAAPR
jgi:hypothetical protein